jgi:hypothetical protein
VFVGVAREVGESPLFCWLCENCPNDDLGDSVNDRASPDPRNLPRRAVAVQLRKWLIFKLVDLLVVFGFLLLYQ